MSTYFLNGGNVSVWSVPRVECTHMHLANAQIAANASAVTVTIDGTEALLVTSNGISAPSFTGDGTLVTTTHMTLANIQITDSSFVPTGATALAANAVGYAVVNGTGFAGTMSAVIGGNVLPTSITTVSSSQIRLVLPFLATGTYPVWLFSDQYPDVRMTTIQASPDPVWTTSTLANVVKYSQFTQTLVATDMLGSNITYTLADGSSLPANVILASNGVLSGTILADPGNTTTYSFSIHATDAEFQSATRTFELTATYAPVLATGGIVTTVGGNTIHTFTSNATLTVLYGGTVEYLLVGGGGGGGAGTGGGGGGGGVLSGNCVLAIGTYPVIIGAGGAGGTGTARGVSGQVTTFNLFGALGGGGGGNNLLDASTPGLSGGSGGGGTVNAVSGAGTQGYRGGAATSWSGYYGCGGGGGGGGIGGDGTAAAGGNGGIGFLSSLSGVSTYYAGGGGGGTYLGGTVGLGGLGGGGNAPAGNATPNTGGGGGAQINNSTSLAGAGASGIAIIKYPFSGSVQSSPTLSVLSGLVGWYDGASWTNVTTFPPAPAQWTDKSGSGNHATVVRGTIGTSYNTKGGLVLTGSTTAGIQFPAAILPATYTLFHVARYTGGTRQRIFDGISQNWLSGFVNPGAPGGLSGVAFHNGWLTQSTTSIHGDNWVVSTDQNNLYRSNGVQRGNTGAGSPSYDRLSINYGVSTKYSDWAVSEVLVYNRTLTITEILSVESYLYAKSGL